MDYSGIQEETLRRILSLYDEYIDRHIWHLELETLNMEQILRERIFLYEALHEVVEDSAKEVVYQTLVEESRRFEEIFQLSKNVSLTADFRQFAPNIITRIMDGSLYPDHISLSQRIWNITGKNAEMMNRVISRALLEGESAIDLSYRLNMFLDESYIQQGYNIFDITKVYPYMEDPKDIVYESFRLARTTINHAHQETQKEAARKSPFCSQMQWHSAMDERSCQVCIDRHLQIYDIDDVPLDHPNGMCYMTQVTPPFEEMIEDIDNWKLGDDSYLDMWYNKDGKEIVSVFFK